MPEPCCELPADGDGPDDDPPGAENFVILSPEEYEEAYQRLHGRKPPTGWDE